MNWLVAFLAADEEGVVMKVINRSALSIKPKEPYLDWANFAATSYESLEDMRRTGRVILLPDAAYNEQEKFLEANYRQLFEFELEAWTPARRSWPEEIDLALFKQWFDVEFYALTLDFSGDELSSELYSWDP